MADHDEGHEAGAPRAVEHSRDTRNPPPREKGRQLERVNAFSDGVFTIAATLLVLSIDLPTGPASRLDDQLVDLIDPTFSYFLSFAVIGRFWLRHHELFGHLRYSDGRFAAINLVFLSFIALLPAPTELLGRYPNHPAPVVLYAVNLVILTLLLRYLVNDAVERGLAGGDSVRANMGRNVGLYIAGTFAISIPIAFVVPRLAVYFWIIAAFAPRLARFVNKRREASPPATG